MLRKIGYGFLAFLMGGSSITLLIIASRVQEDDNGATLLTGILIAFVWGAAAVFSALAAIGKYDPARIRPGWGFLAFICGNMAAAGIGAMSDPDGPGNLPVGIVFLLLTYVCVKKAGGGRMWNWPGRKNKSKVQSGASRSFDSPPVQAMLQESIPLEVHSSRVETEEDITVQGAPISYLDARALKFWNKKTTDFQIPSYYAESAFGRNARPALARLLSKKYLEAGGLEKSIGLKTVPELKALLAARKLPVSGKKAELILRLMDNIPTDELEAMFPARVYEITEAGEDALKYYSIVFTSEDHNLSLSSYRLLKEREARPALTDKDLLLQLLLEDLDKADRNGQQETYRITAGQTARFLEEIGKIRHAFGVYCAAFFLFWYRNTAVLKVDGPAEAYGYPAKSIERCGQLCGYSWSETLTHFQECVKEINPFGLGTKRNIDTAIKVLKEALSM